MTNIYNYPNPASSVTWFRIEHNRPGEELELTISIFDIAGRIIASLKQSGITTGFSFEPLEWDLKDKTRIKDNNGNFDENYSKVIILRH